jgi:hypothetical protein
MGMPAKCAHIEVPSTLTVPAGNAADGSDHRAIGEDAAHAGGAVEAGVGKQLADHEGPRLLRCEFLGDGRRRSEYAGTDDGNAQIHRRLHKRHEPQVSKIP